MVNRGEPRRTRFVANMEDALILWTTLGSPGEPRRTTVNQSYVQKLLCNFFYILGLVDKVCRFPALHYMIKKHSKAFGMLFLPKTSNAGVFW